MGKRLFFTYQVSRASTPEVDKGGDEQGRNTAEKRVRCREITGLLLRDSVAHGNGAECSGDHAGTDYIRG